MVVLSNNDGCIVARSREAKALNIPDLKAYFQLRPFLEQHGVQVFSSNYELYGDISNRVMQIIQDYGHTEIYSIDESFLDMSGCTYINPKAFIHDIQQRIWQEVRMPVSIGVSHSKTLAKAANYISKRSNRLNGLCILQETHTIEEALKRIPVGKLWGIGSKLNRHLAHANLHTAYQLSRCDPKAMRKLFSVNMERTIRELRGEACIELEQQQAKKNIICSRMFGHKVTQYHELKQAVSQYACRAGRKLRKQNSVCQAVLVNINTSRFIDTPYSASFIIGFKAPTEDNRNLISAAHQALDKVFLPNKPYAKATVGLLQIRSKQFHQSDLFEPSIYPHSEKLMGVIDQLNRHQANQLFFASDGIDVSWKMMRSMKSPSYTTQWRDIPNVNIKA